MRTVHYAWVAVAIATVSGQCVARADVAIPGSGKTTMALMLRNKDGGELVGNT
jgi:hypothetical protein